MLYQIDVWGSLGQGRVQLRGDATDMRVLRGRGSYRRW